MTVLVNVNDCSVRILEFPGRAFAVNRLLRKPVAARQESHQFFGKASGRRNEPLIPEIFVKLENAALNSAYERVHRRNSRQHGEIVERCRGVALARLVPVCPDPEILVVRKQFGNISRLREDHLCFFRADVSRAVDDSGLVILALAHGKSIPHRRGRRRQYAYSQSACGE